MDGWRDQGANYNQEITRTRSNSHRKPPQGGNSNWQQSVPSWEKKFCSSVGSVPWKKLVETKKFIHLYENVIKWNDSAGKEAFQIAKNNFYANLHGLPSENPSFNPDIYIDKIDWNSEVDPNLILDLDSDSVVPDSGSVDEQVIIFGSSFPPSYQNFSPYGWGDSDDDKNKKKDGEKSSGGEVANNESWWGWDENVEKTKMYDNNDYFYGDANNETKAANMSRFKTSRFTGNRTRRGTGRRSAGAQAAAYGCAPAGGGGGNRWSVKKTVS